MEIPIEIIEEEVPYKAPVAVPHLVPPKHKHYGGEVKIPSADVIDCGEWYKIIADLPGVSRERIKVTADEKGLKYICRERCYSNLCRYITFQRKLFPLRLKLFCKMACLR